MPRFNRDIAEWFVPESVAVSSVLDDSALIASDFRIDPAGHQRFLLSVTPGDDMRRVGLMMQRLCEIETYKSMSMLGFARVREMNPRMGELEDRMRAMIGDMTGGDNPPRKRCRICWISRRSWRTSLRKARSGSGRRRPMRTS
jgi:uncharacterized membrane-anchored protein